MRGTLSRLEIASAENGIIPAYAGNTYRMLLSQRNGGDHPRVCGEHLLPNTLNSVASGSSPRMRGTHTKVTAEGLPFGIIPAYAGNTLRDYSNFVVSKFMSFVFHLV